MSEKGLVLEKVLRISYAFTDVTSMSLNCYALSMLNSSMKN